MLRRYYEWSHKRKYKAALKNCKAIAKEEYPYAQKALDSAYNLAQKLQQRMDKTRDNAAELQGTAPTEAQEKLDMLSRQLKEVVKKDIEAASDALTKKKKRLEKFTVTLFGRTMAGKSTIREAITHGNGESIGKGAQRTTRDIKEYEWNYLRIIDTPGIGAYKGETDSAYARSVIDESDVLLFLVSSDGIQETSFGEMSRLRGQNKPIIFVLNMMRDMNRSVYRRKFLRSPASVMDKQAIKGHTSRTRKLASDELGMRDVIIVPVHAQAAFLATRPEHASDSDALHQASGMDDLLNVLTNEVLQRGTVRRLQTLLDGTIVQLMDFEERLHNEQKEMHRVAKHLKDNFEKLSNWFDGYIGTIDQRIEHHVSEVLRPLRDSVSTFVDENIERADVEARWTSKVKSLNIDGKMDNFGKQIKDEIQGHLEEFNRQVAVDYNLLGTFNKNIKGPAQYNPSNTKRTLGRIAAGSALLTSVAAFAIKFGAANFWNPVGWIAGVVAGVCVFLAWFSSDREKKLQRQKNKAAKQLREQISSMEQNIVKNTKTWFCDNITRKLVKGLQKETRQLYKGMFDISKALREAATTCAEEIEVLNRRLLLRCGAFVGEKVAECSISSITRDPGIKTKFICADGSVSNSFCEEVGKALGESIDKVEQAPFQQMIATALYPAKIDPDNVKETNSCSHRTIVRLPASQMAWAIGKKGSNVRLASRLMKTHIQLQKEE